MTSKVHHLRDSTLSQTEVAQSKPRVYSGRHYVPIEQAASLKLPEDHVCGDTVPDFSQQKLQMRIYGLFISYAITEAFLCTVYRAKTDLQCGKSSCECESAHYFNTPTSRDNQMLNVFSQLDNNLPLSPVKTAYVSARCNFTTSEKENFNHLPSLEKKTFIQKRIVTDDLHNSFYATSFELQSSGTIEGSTIANDFDQFIENRLRPIEDKNRVAIEQKLKTAQQAIDETYDALYTMVSDAVTNLKVRKEQLENYFAMEALLHQIEENYLETHDVSQRDKYIEAVSELIKLRSLIKTRMACCTNFDKNRFEKMAHRKDFFWLNEFLRTQASVDTEDLKNASFRAHMQKISKEPMESSTPKGLQITESMLEEAQNQLIGLEGLGKKNVARLSTLLFGINEKNLRRPPTDLELKEQIVEMTRKTFSIQSGKRKSLTDNKENLKPKKRRKINKGSSDP